MSQHPLTDSSEASASALPVFAPPLFGVEFGEPRNSLEQNTEERTGYLLKHIESLESCNAALCNKLARVEAELATLKNPVVQPGAEHGTKQTYGWERKLTRVGWRPP